MDDYISRQAAKNALTVGFSFHYYAGGTACAIIDDIPSADVVPVLRCRDCHYSREPDRHSLAEGRAYKGILVCSVGLKYVYPTANAIFVEEDHFCKYGVRRKEK